MTMNFSNQPPVPGEEELDVDESVHQFLQTDEARFGDRDYVTAHVGLIRKGVLLGYRNRARNLITYRLTPQGREFYESTAE